MLKVVAKNYADLNHLDEILSLCRELVDITRGEEGCVNYGVYQDVEHPELLTMRCAPLALPYRDVHETIPTAVCLGPCAEFRRTMPNALTLDLCRYRTAGEWSGEMDLWRAQREIRAAAGFRQIFGNGQAMRSRLSPAPLCDKWRPAACSA